MRLRRSPQSFTSTLTNPRRSLSVTFMSSSSTQQTSWLIVLFSLPVSLIAGCGTAPDSQADRDKIQLTAWYHSGQKGERETIQKQVQRFNNHQDEIEVQLTIIPEGTYNNQIQSAA